MTTAKRKVIHLTSVHPPGDPRIYDKMCRSLADAGYDVSLIAPCESFHRDPRITVIPVKRRAGRLARMVLTSARVFREAVRRPADVYHFHDPELMPWAVLLRLMGRKVIYDVHEKLPALIMGRDYLPKSVRGAVAAFFGGLELLMSSVFTAVCAATPGIAARFKRRGVTVVQNFPMLNDFQNLDVGDFQSRSHETIYVGSITEARGIREVMAALELLAVQRPTPVKLCLAGNMAPASLLSDLQRLPSWRFVEYLGYVQRNEAMQLGRDSRVGLVVLRPVPNYLDSYPTKLFEYLAGGTPVVASDFPLWREIVERSQCGILVDPLDPGAIAKAIARLLDHPEAAAAMGQRGREMVLADFNWAKEERKLLDLYSSI